MIEKFTLETFIQLPKAELHCHLDGSLRLNTIIELANQANISLPTQNAEALKKHLKFGLIHQNLDDYLEMFNLPNLVMQTAENLHRIAFELAEDAAKENIWHLEVRFCPTYFTNAGLTFIQITEAITAGLNEAEIKYRISTAIILCAIRTLEEDENFKIAELANKSLNNKVMALDLAGSEDGYNNKNFQKVFDWAHENKINITIHAGEDAGSSNIHQALIDCHASRIGHGTHIVEDPQLTKEVIDKQITLEVCLSSNLQTRSVKNIKDHPAVMLLRKNANITLNTDNRLMSDTTLSKEYYLAYKNFDLSQEEITQLIANSFKSAFLPDEVKEILLEKALKETKQILAF